MVEEVSRTQAKGTKKGGKEERGRGRKREEEKEKQPPNISEKVSDDVPSYQPSK